MIIRWPFRIAGVVVAAHGLLVWSVVLAEVFEPGRPVLGGAWGDAFFAMTAPLFVLVVGVPSVFGSFPDWFRRMVPEFLRSLLRANREAWLIGKFGWKGGYFYVFCLGPIAILIVLGFGAVCALYAWIAGAYWVSLIWAALTLFVVGAELNDLVHLFRFATIDRECATCMGQLDG